MAYKPKRSGGKKGGASNARARRAASRAVSGVSRAPAEKAPQAPVGTRPLHADEVRAAIEPTLAEFSLVVESIKITGPAQNCTVEITVDYTEDRADSLSLDTIAEISGVFSAALDRADANDEFFPYLLEVSSPGATRELSERRHWCEPEPDSWPLPRLMAPSMWGALMKLRMTAQFCGGRSRLRRGRNLRTMSRRPCRGSVSPVLIFRLISIPQPIR